MSTQKTHPPEPRELWLIINGDSAFVMTEKPEHGALAGLATHVVEHSALEQAQAKFEEEKRAHFSTMEDLAMSERVCHKLSQNEPAEAYRIVKQALELSQSAGYDLLKENARLRAALEYAKDKIENLGEEYGETMKTRTEDGEEEWWISTTQFSHEKEEALSEIERLEGKP